MGWTQAYPVQNWGSSPEFHTTLYYDQQRNGANMEYKFKFSTIIGNGSSSSYSYPVNYSISLDGTVPTGWSGSYSQSSGTVVYESADWVVIPKSTGTTTIRWFFDAQGSSYRSLDKSLAIAVIVSPSQIGTVEAFNFEDAISVPVTKYSSTFSDTLNISIGNISLKSIENYISDTAFSFTSDELLNVYANMPNTSDTITFEITTYDGSTSVGSTSTTATGSIAGAIHIKNDDGNWVRAIPWYNDSGTWKRCIVHINNNGTWVRGV